ncbi:MAG: Outer membrane protein OprM [Chlamydiia bacterium]|nr:Outer membrane protein OprM [Chlamydiia bacterium]MCH9615486.1 Outer membrane protein OprM [Chlamydiia bacterium]MCH9629141.1 Outer membrane protein OprM [Chlamydiia bacterium]
MYYLIILTLFLFGCQKKHKPPEIKTSVQINTEVDSLYAKGEWPDPEWWTDLKDNQLNWMVDQTIHNNPTLSSAMANIKEAFAEAKKVRAPLFPHLSGVFEEAYTHLSKNDIDRYPPSMVPAVINQLRLYLDVEWEIDVWGKTRDSYHAALNIAKARMAEASFTKLMLSTSVVSTYFQLDITHQEIAVTRELLERKRLYYELIGLRYQNGLEQKMAIDNAEMEVLKVEQALSVLLKNVDLYIFTLKRLMGLDPGYDLHIEKPSARLPKKFTLPDNLPIGLLARRPDLMMRIFEVESAALEVGVARKAFYPSINLGLRGGIDSLKWSDLFSASSLMGAISPGINLPIFTGGKLTANLSAKESAYDSMVYEYNANILKAAQEVADGIRTLQENTDQILLQEEILLRRATNLELEAARYDEGVSNYLDVLLKQEEVMTAQIDQLDRMMGERMNYVALIKALGGGY